MREEKSWKEIREAARAEYNKEINTATKNEILRRLAAKGALRALDEKFATTDDKAEIVAGTKVVPSLTALAEGASRVPLKEQAKALIGRAITISDDAVRAQILELLIGPTRETIAEAETLLTANE